MESKIMIDINYASRDPQIVIHQKESDDPRDKLVSMLTGHAMPGVRDGYCLIERYPTEGVIIITPLYPTEVIKHIPLIAKLAINNNAIDTTGVEHQYATIITDEYDRVGIKKADNDEEKADFALAVVEEICRAKLKGKNLQKWEEISVLLK